MSSPTESNHIPQALIAPSETLPRPPEQARHSERGKNESPASAIVRQRMAEEAAPLSALFFVP